MTFITRCALGLVACVSFIGLSACTGYRQDMAQGQQLTLQQVNAIHKGMTRQAVIDQLGAPVLQTIYDPNKMVYMYTMWPARGHSYKKQLLITLHQGQVTAVAQQGY